MGLAGAVGGQLFYYLAVTAWGFDGDPGALDGKIIQDRGDMNLEKPVICDGDGGGVRRCDGLLYMKKWHSMLLFMVLLQYKLLAVYIIPDFAKTKKVRKPKRYL